MKKYIRIVLEKYTDHTSYASDSNVWPDELTLLRMLAIDGCPEKYLSLLQEQNFAGLNTNLVEVHWSRKHNIVIITAVPDCECCGENAEKKARGEEIEYVEEEFLMTFDSFKTMIEDWSALRKKRAPEIYFIKIGRGQVVARASLEGFVADEK